MDRTELIKYCRYYDGNETAPLEASENKLIYRVWLVERIWVNEALEQEEKGDHAISPNIDKWVDDCIHYIPAGSIIPGDVPATLNSAIFSVFLYHNELPVFEEFLPFYDKWYNRKL